MFFYLLILFSLYIFIFCDRKSEFNYEPVLNVVGILRNDEHYPIAIIDRAYETDEPAEYNLENALVYISGPNVMETLFYYDYNNYFSALNPINIQPESVYHLFVQVPGFESVKGSTRIPGRFQIINPAWYDTITVEDTLIFTKSKGGAVYYVLCQKEDAGNYYYWVYFPELTNDTIMKIPIIQFQTEYIVANGFYQFTIVAHDSNYFNYEFYWGSEPPAYGIENGIGFFGSAWVETIIVYVKIE